MRLALALLLALLPRLAAAERVAARAGNHPDFGRLVFDWPAPPAYTLEQQGDQALLRFPAGTTLALPNRSPRNFLSITGEDATVRIVLRPGARLKHYRLGGRVVVDALDPPGPVAPPARAALPPTDAAARPDQAPPARPVATRPAPPDAAKPPAPPPQPAATAAIPAPAPVPPPAPVRQVPAARLLRMPGGPASALLPFPAGTGAALLRRGDSVLAVFDSPEPPDLAPLRGDPLFGGLVAAALPGATLLRLPLPAGAALQTRHDAAGWVLDPGRPPADATPPALALEAEAGPPPRLLLKVAAPGRVVPVPDPETGLPLLLGTLRDGVEALPLGRRLPEFDLPPTLLGVAVLARSDGIALQPGTDRFVLSAGGGVRLALDAEVTQVPTSPAMTRSFDLPPRPPAEWLQRLQGLQSAIAGAPPLGRVPQRRAAGEALLALGLPHEAQAMLGLGFAEDPGAAADPGYAALAAAAALLAGRLGEAAALRAPGWPDSDEATLWRAALAAAEGDPKAAGPALAATLPLLLAYPQPLRSRLLPPAAMALAEAGEAGALRRMVEAAGPEAEGLALPRAILAEQEGKAEEALDGYDAVAAGRDRQARAMAIRRAVDLRLATGRMTPAEGAKALEAALFAWRGDAAEIGARLRLAALRRDSGDARGALALLRETAAMAPDQATQLQPELRTSFLAALAEAPPLAAVALYDAYPETLAGDARAEDAVRLLVERLLALDLGDRAAALLRQAMEHAGGAARATLGLRLAGLRLDAGDPPGALAALADSVVPGLPERVAQDRAVLAARADSRSGHAAEAIEALRALGPAGGEALAEMLTESADWSGAAAALALHLDATLPPPPAPLGDAERRALLRQAALFALAGEDAALATLRAAQATRMGEGPLAEAFGLLTADPLRGLADLPKLQRELQLFRNLPKRLEALRAGAPVTR